MMRYTIRVYGILERNGSILISREYFKGKLLFKFPGGGMEEGEGTLDTLIREFKEELDIEVMVRGHLYTTDFHAVSHFDSSVQVISVYYIIETNDYTAIRVSEKGSIPDSRSSESFQWYPIKELNTSLFTFETEATAFEKLLEVISL